MWTDEKQRWKGSERREAQKREDQRRESVRRKKMQVCEKVGKPRDTAFFQWFVALEGRKVGSLKRRVQSHLARWEMKNCTRLWGKAHFHVKMYKAHQLRTTFSSWDVEKVHAVVARSTFRSQKCKKMTGTEHFWTFRCAYAWQAQGIVHLVKSEPNVRVLWHVQKRWQAWDIWRGSSKRHFVWWAQYKSHVHQRC